jgi:hypothetical protein
MVSSGLLLMYSLGAVVGPLLASAAMAQLGGGGLYLTAGSIHALLIVYVAQRVLRRKPTAPDHHITFTDALASAHTASQVYEEEID